MLWEIVLRPANQNRETNIWAGIVDQESSKTGSNQRNFKWALGYNWRQLIKATEYGSQVI